MPDIKEIAASVTPSERDVDPGNALANGVSRVPTPDLPSGPVHEHQASVQPGLQETQARVPTEPNGVPDIQVSVRNLGVTTAKRPEDDVDAGVEVQIDSGSDAGSSDSDESDDERDGDDVEDEDLQRLGASFNSTCSRVTFRPRVRIGSGISRPRRQSGHQPRPTDELTYQDILSACSSRSCSPSSSISAPLRFHSEEDSNKPGRWGTLGQRVGLLARRGEHKRRFRDRMKRHERMLKSFQGVHRMHHSSLRRPSYSDETRPLLDARYAQYICQCGLAGCEYDERRIAEEIDILFGKWPVRLFNPKWWWWHVQPIVFCRWLDDPEDEVL